MALKLLGSLESSGGNVGIGTSSPSKTLHVYSGTDNEGIFMEGTGNGHWFNFKSGTSNLWSMGAQAGLMGWYNRTDSTYKMVIADAGNVGIGTTSPGSAFKLDVNGYIKANSRIYVRDSTKTLEFGTDYIQSYVTSGTGVNPIRFFTGTTEKTRIDGNGNVGIGTTAPLEKLHVVGKINSSNNIVSNSTYTMFTGRSSRTVDDYGGLNKEYFKANLVTAGPNTTGEASAHGLADLRFQLANSAGNTGMSDIMTLRSGGNVGIGTATPAAKLTVAGTIQTIGGTNNSKYAQIVVNDSWAYYTTNAPNIYMNADLRVDTGKIGSYNEDLELRTSGTTRIQVNNTTGNVGIGTTSPAEKLEVVGTIKATSTGTATLILRGDSGNSGDTGQLDSTIKMLHDDENHGILLETRNYAGAQTFEIKSLTASNETSRFLIDQDGTLKIPAYGAGFLITDSNGDVTLDTNSYATQTWVGEQNYASDAAISTALASYLPLAGGTMTGALVITEGASDQTNSADTTALPSTTGAEFMRINGAYTDGRYATEFAKVDRGGNLPLYIRQSKTTANSFANIARFGDHSNSSHEFEVFGSIKATGGDSGNWNTAYGWGNHGSAGYLTTSSAATTYAPKASPALTGTPTAPTAGSTTNTTQIATTAFVQTAVSNLVDSAPGALNTLNELAAALGDDANFSTTITNSIATKLPLAGGTMTGNLTVSNSNNSATSVLIGNSGTGVARTYFDASNGDFAGGDYMWIGQNNDLSGEIVMTQSAGAFHIKTQPSGTITSRLTVLQNGNVGIGTDSPSTKLEVAGSIKHTGLELTSGTSVDQISEFAMTFRLVADTWTDTGIDGTDLSTGTYAMQVYVSDFGVGGQHYDEYYSATISWYAIGTNSTAVDEIPVHRAGHAPNNGDIQFRTQRASGSDSHDLMLQVKTNSGYTENLNNSTSGKIMRFKFRRLM